MKVALYGGGARACGECSAHCVHFLLHQGTLRAIVLAPALQMHRGNTRTLSTDREFATPKQRVVLELA